MIDIQSVGLTVGVIGFGVVKVLSYAGWLPQKKSPGDILSEIKIRENQINRLDTRVAHLTSENLRLANETNLSPIVASLERNTQLQDQILDRLIHHNGSFAHIERSLADTHEAIKLLTGFVVGIHEPTVPSPK